MTVLTTDEIDRELASRTKEVAAMSATLIELDEPSRARARASLSADRRDRATVGGDREVTRAAVGGPGADDVDPGLGAHGAGAPIEARRRRPRRVDEVAARAAARGVAPAESRWRSVRSAAPVKRSSTSGSPTRRNGCAPPTRPWSSSSTPSTGSTHWSPRGSHRRRNDSTRPARPDPKEIAELLAVSATDPLSLTTRDVEKRITAIADSVERRSAELAELAALQANWPDALATTASAAWTTLRDATQRAAQIRTHAEQNGAGRPASRSTPTPNRTCAPSCGRSPHRIRRRCGRCGTGSRRRCEPRARTNSSRRACSTVAANSRDG